MEKILPHYAIARRLVEYLRQREGISEISPRERERICRILNDRGDEVAAHVGLQRKEVSDIRRILKSRGLDSKYYLLKGLLRVVPKEKIDHRTVHDVMLALRHARDQIIARALEEAMIDGYSERYARALENTYDEFVQLMHALHDVMRNAIPQKASVRLLEERFTHGPLPSHELLLLAPYLDLSSEEGKKRRRYGHTQAILDVLGVSRDELHKKYSDADEVIRDFLSRTDAYPDPKALRIARKNIATLMRTNRAVDIICRELGIDPQPFYITSFSAGSPRDQMVHVIEKMRDAGIDVKKVLNILEKHHLP